MTPRLRYVPRPPRPVIIALALAAIVLGGVLIGRPTTALGVLALLIGAGLVLAGIIELALPLITGKLRMPLAVALIITGVVVLVLPGLTVRMLALIVGIALIVRAALAVLAAFTARAHTLDRRIAEGLLGIAGLAFGAVALAWPDITLLVVAVVFGLALVITGIAVLVWLIRQARADRYSEGVSHPARTGERLVTRWLRTIAAVCAVALAAGALVVSVTLRQASPVVDEFYAPPRSVPSEPGALIRAETFTRGIPENAQAWRILYTTTHGDGSSAVASGLVVVPNAGTKHPVIAWHHGTTGFDRSCAPSLASEPFSSGALFVLDRVVDQGWALVATDYIGLGTEGPHPYLIGEVSAYAELDAVRAARHLEDASLGTQTVAWGHSQGGAASLWSTAIAAEYAPDVPLEGSVALAPAADLPALVETLPEVTGGSVFASFVVSAYSAIYPDVSFRQYIRPGAEATVREMARRCLAEPATLVSVLTLLALKDDPNIIARDPATGALGRRLAENVPPATTAVPTLLGQGAADDLVRASMQDGYVASLCADGAVVDYRSYAGLDHLSLAEPESPAMADAIAWSADRFAGLPAQNTCTG